MPPVSRIAPLSCWRTLPADQFSNTRTVAIRKSLAAIHLLDEPCWRAALAGDDAAAVGVAVKLMPVERITCRTDMVMSALCLSALHGSAAACLVLGHILKQVGAIANSHADDHHRGVTIMIITPAPTGADRESADLQRSPRGRDQA
jgi:hypothetical protein